MLCMWDISIENRIQLQFYWINYNFIANTTFPLATSCWARKEKVCFDLTKKILNFLPSWGRQRHFSFRQMLENTAKNTWILVHQVSFQEINIKFHIIFWDFKALSCCEIEVLSQCQKKELATLHKYLIIFCPKKP